MVNDVLKLSEGPMDVSAWDIDKDLIGLPGGAIWDLNASESLPEEPVSYLKRSGAPVFAPLRRLFLPAIFPAFTPVQLSMAVRY